MRTRGPLRAATLAGALAILHARGAFADGIPPPAEPARRLHVVILGPSSNHRAVVRMRGELTALGIDVDLLEHVDPGAPLEGIARRLGASAAIRIEAEPPAAVLWVDPAVSTQGSPHTLAATGSARLERIERIERIEGADTDPALLALRAVELLRARLLKLPEATTAPVPAPVAASVPSVPSSGASPAPIFIEPRPDLPPTPPPNALPSLPANMPANMNDEPRPVPVAGRRRMFGLAAAPAMLVSPGGVSPSFGVRGSAEWDTFERFGLEIAAFIPGSAGRVTTAEGSIDVSMLTVGGGVRALLTNPAWRFGALVSGGVDAARISYSAQATPPFMGVSDSTWRVAPYVTATAAYRVHPMVSLRLDLAALVVLPESPVAVAGQSVAPYAMPALVPSIGVEVRP